MRDPVKVVIANNEHVPPHGARAVGSDGTAVHARSRRVDINILATVQRTMRAGAVMLPTDYAVCLSHRHHPLPLSRPSHPYGYTGGATRRTTEISPFRRYGVMYKSVFRFYGMGLEHHPFLELVHPNLSVL